MPIDKIFQNKTKQEKLLERKKNVNVVLEDLLKSGGKWQVSFVQLSADKSGAHIG